LKTILLLRHGKSSWQDTTLHDFDRPLKKRGKRAAKKMGKEIRRRDLLPDFILASAAWRTRQTARRVAQAADYNGKITEETKLYGTDVRRHLEVLSGVDDTYNRVLLVGHNPDLEELVEHWTGQAVAMPTGALVGLRLEIDSWTAVPEASGQVLFTVTPKELL
jgi:phosphohistidine phosphatase